MEPLGFVVFVIAAFAEAARLPFDLPEAEQELIGGYHTEYSGIKLLLFLVAEFLHMITASFLIVILFFGGWHLPFDLTGDGDSIGWGLAILRVTVLMTKIFLVIVFFMLVRWSWPRFRFDQLMALAWKVILPLGMVNLVSIACLEEARLAYSQELYELFGTWTELAVIACVWGISLAILVTVTLVAPLIADNRPRRDIRLFEVNPQIK